MWQVTGVDFPIFSFYTDLKMDYFGLDIGSRHIKAAWIKKEGKNQVLLGLGEADNVVAGDFFSSPQQQDAVAEIIKKLKVDLQIEPKTVVANIPESRVISRVVVLPPMKESEIIQALRYEAETFVPYSLKDVQIDYQIIEKDEQGKQHIFVVAAKTEFISGLSTVLKKAGLVPLALENGATALTRALCPLRSSPTLILEIGNRETMILVAKNGNPYITRVLPLGGEAFTRAVSLALGMDQFKAEEYKKAYGLKKGQWQDKIRTALLDVLSNLVEEVRKTMIGFEEEWRQKIDLLILSGGGAMVPNLADELIAALGIELQWGKPFTGLDRSRLKTTVDIAKEELKFSVVIGLAKRNLE